LAHTQSDKVFAQLVTENGTASGVEGVKDMKVLAVIAYMQRLGTDLNKPIDVAPAAPVMPEPKTAPLQTTSRSAP
jgi:hypothetical protein